jgi:MFS family permease
MASGPVTRAHLKTPKAAAIAGMVFSILAIVVFWLLRTSIPADPQEPGSWLQGNSDAVTLALNLMPFAGIAFLWFIGVLRDRLGEQEDRFFATVFFGSGLLFLAMLFTAAAIVGAILIAFAMQPQQLIDSATFHLARAAAYSVVNVYMVKMASVFMITTSTVAIYTGIAPRWFAILGIALALILLFGSFYISWSFLVFPLWVFLISAFILKDSRRPTGQ